MQDFQRRFTFLTASSARPLDGGLYADDALWFTPYRDKKSQVGVVENLGLSSLDRLMETPNVIKKGM